MISWYDSCNIRQVLNTYDSKSRVIKQVDANNNIANITYLSDRTIMTDNEGNEQVYMLDSKKRNTQKLFTSSESNDSIEYTKSFTSSSKIEKKTDGNNVEIRYTYDSKGNVIKEEKSDGINTISKTYTYDENNNKTSESDYNGNITTYTYDTRNNE